MKIRNGFVSNSSSSSFLILFKKEDFDKMLDTFNDFEKEVVNRIGKNKVKVFGNDCVKMEWGSGEAFEDGIDEDGLEELLENLEDIDMYAEIEDVKSKIEDFGKKCNAFTHCLDF